MVNNPDIDEFDLNETLDVFFKPKTIRNIEYKRM